MNRLNDTEYNNLFTEIESADVLDMNKLNILSYERSARSYEAIGCVRSQRSVQNVRFIKLVSALERKHNCTLVGRNQKDNSVRYERREAGFSKWAWAK